jgi:hypothetical protein
MRLRTRNEFEYAEQGFSDAGLRKRSLFLRINGSHVWIQQNK